MIAEHRVVALLTRALFAALGLLWLAVAALVVTHAIDLGPVGPDGGHLLAALMVGFAVVMGLLAWRVLRGGRVVDGIAVAVAALNVGVTLTDEVGTWDLVYLTLSVGLLGALVLALFLQRRAGAAER